MIIKVLGLAVAILFILWGLTRISDYKKLLMMSDINDPERKKRFIKRLRFKAYAALAIGLILLIILFISMVDFPLLGTQQIE